MRYYSNNTDIALPLSSSFNWIYPNIVERRFQPSVPVLRPAYTARHRSNSLKRSLIGNNDRHQTTVIRSHIHISGRPTFHLVGPREAALGSPRTTAADPRNSQGPSSAECLHNSWQSGAQTGHLRQRSHRFGGNLRAQFDRIGRFAVAGYPHPRASVRNRRHICPE